MRILAPRKRDSVTGEEVVLAVTNNVVVTSSRTTHNSSTGNNNNITNSSVLITRPTDCSPPVDVLLKEKLFLNTLGDDNARSPLQQSVNYGKQKSVLKSIKSRKKARGWRKSVCSSAAATTTTTTTSNWRDRISSSVTNFLVIVINSQCCVAQKERDLCVKKNGITNVCTVDVENNNKLKSNVRSSVIEGNVLLKGETISTESQLGKCANSAVFSEASQNSFVSDSNFSVKNYSKILPAAPPLENINVEDTKKPAASDKNRVATAGTANFKIMRTGIYHEKQVKSLCALHALNNLLQDGKAFKQEDLDKICSELDPNSWVNPHKSVFGLGNYDINVIMTALQQKRLEAVWFDKRKDPSEELNFGNIYGFILNIPSDCRLGWLALPIKRKHWVAIRNLPSPTEKDAGRSNYYNLDSKFDKPESIGTTDNLIEYLRSELKSPEKELFLVVIEDIGRLETWRKNPPPPSTVEATAASGSSTQFLPVPTTSGESGPDAAAGSGNNRRTSNDSGVVDLLPDLRDINVVDLNKEDLMRRQSSGVWSDLT